ncbi:MAG TPA: HD domain-containing protein [Spirochaetota bacterium]|nr:HD domain-containing protein [Spirochaetota bacterium]HPU90433.1 HD domain-containing protein [Spirochaetota bacterium]
METKKVKINLSYLRPNSTFIYPLFSEEGKKILDERIVLTAELIKKITARFGNFVYYAEDGKRAVIQEGKLRAALATSHDVLDEIARTSKLSAEKYHEAERLVDDIIHNLSVEHANVINLIKDLKSFDDYLYNHSVNVGLLTAVFAKKIGGFSDHQYQSITLGAYLHDIGQRKIDKQLLHKQGQLDVLELTKLKRHPQLGYEILKDLEDSNETVLQTVLFHHEKYNHKGYYQLPYENLPIFPKLASICDIYDALTSPRPFREEPFTSCMALKAIVNSISSHFDFTLVSRFVNLMGPILNNDRPIFAVNDICELNTGELALVKGITPGDILKPQVVVFCRFVKEGDRLGVKHYNEPTAADLATENKRVVKKILNNRKQVDAIQKMAKERGLL